MKFFKSFDESNETTAWLVTIPLTGGGRIELAHRFEKKGLAAISLGPLAEILRTRVDLERHPVIEQDSQHIEEMSNSLQKAVS
ncbi:MAG: hypothetical protein WBC04_01225, partial [Candidatus Acidiferrales bacterium]